MSDTEFLAKRNEHCRQMLQQIKDNPANEMEAAFREHHLVGMSDPKLWGENLPSVVGYALQMFEEGWKAKEAAKSTKEVLEPPTDEQILAIRREVAEQYVSQRPGNSC
ncbi:hypothetical protein [Herbaspirillum aquaticum]|uniref:Uncharacterized protein n=1 Tax=Herbaspirillum aquaticum TaxID=568783 RepID=A0A225SMS5_9BURK|nr:hypothetical protein [Herbaspirillum aquaticum]OWY32222.1 hypothetical protein CEJ45_22210 [Herbaspirillum aquaticum]